MAEEPFGRVPVGLAESLPFYTEKDLVVCHRQNSSGAWKCELWSNRAFAPKELCFAPLTSQVKDTHVTLTGHCPVQIPSVGPGAHPQNQSWSLDGPGRMSLVSQDLVDDKEHRGCLFWLVQRAISA